MGKPFYLTAWSGLWLAERLLLWNWLDLHGSPVVWDTGHSKKTPQLRDTAADISILAPRGLDSATAASHRLWKAASQARQAWWPLGKPADFLIPGRRGKCFLRNDKRPGTSVNTIPHFKAVLSSWLYNQDEQLRF